MKPRSVAVLTLILGAATLAAASSYPTVAPVSYIDKNETCPEKCFCTPLDNNIEVVCPTEETIDRIENNTFPKDVDPEEDVELLGAASDVHDDAALPEKISQVPENEISHYNEDVAEAPLEFPDDKVADEFKVTKKPAVVLDAEDNFSLPEEGLMQSDQPVDDSEEDENVTEHEEVDGKAENPAVIEDVDQNLDAVPSEKPTEIAVEEKLASASVQNLEATPSSAPEDDGFRLPDDNEEPEPTAAEVTASLSPLGVSVSTNNTDSEEEGEAKADLDGTKSSEESAEVDKPEQPLVFNDTEVNPVSVKPDQRVQPEDPGSIEDVLSPEPVDEGDTVTEAPIMIVNKKVDNVETNNLVMTPMDGEMSGKIIEETPESTESPQQSATSWVILGIILAMFVGVLLYAAIKGKVENAQEGAAKIPSVSSNVPEFAKNRKPSGEEGTEMKEMSKALLSSPSSPLESRVSRFIDEECEEEQLKRFIPQELDEILEQVIVEPQDSPRPVNNAVEKPPRKFIQVPNASEEQERSNPNSPTLVRTKVVDMSPQVPRVISNGNSSNPFGEE